MKVIIWSKPACPQCDQAKHLLSASGYDIEERKIGTGEWTREKLLEIVPSAKSVPQIFFGDMHIGGLAELKQKLTGVK